MRSKQLQEGTQATFALIFESGDEVMTGILTFAREHGIHAAHFTAIGAFSHAVLGYFEWDRKDYRKLPVAEQVEVLSLVGDIARQDDAVKVHAHVVLGKRDGSAHGGHLFEGHVRPTLEVILVQSPSYLEREFDPESGLPLIAP